MGHRSMAFNDAKYTGRRRIELQVNSLEGVGSNLGYSRVLQTVMALRTSAIHRTFIQRLPFGRFVSHCWPSCHARFSMWTAMGRLYFRSGLGQRDT